MSDTAVQSKPAAPTFTCSLLSGAVAGFGVDVALFPLDTLKTRLQSSQGFIKAGGFKGVYNGLGSAAVGSAPGAAMFFSTYETSKKLLNPSFGSGPVTHMAAASIGEIMACLVRVPTENVKQKMQAGLYKTNSECLSAVLKDGAVNGLYKGYSTTVLRDVPFSLIQFPLYEQLKKVWAKSQGSTLSPVQGALCGSFAGAIAAACTCPLDVAKTRLMLGADSQGVPYTTLGDTLKRVYAEGGTKSLFSGLQPRVMWISIGGLVFFGLYEQSVKTISTLGM